MAYTDIDKSDDYFNTKLYTGNGSTQSITGVGFQPDWVWYKGRNDTEDPKIFDIVRGVTNALKPNGTDAEFTQSGVTSFDSDGFTLGSHTGGNENGINYVAWNWLADNTSGSSNTDGSITSNVSVNTTSGFSIVSYTGTFVNATIGHGLGVAPKMIIIKQRNATRNWPVGHDGMGWTKYLYLDSSNASNTGNFFNDTAPTNSVFSIIGPDSGVNASGGTYIAYCFAEKKGFSKIGSYVGNGSTDGAFVYTGFKPAWVIQKPIDVVQNWQIHDTKRDGYNPKNDNLSSNNANAEADNKFIDILSNGFKLRRSDVLNVSGDNYIYMAFAENPFVTSTGIPALAR